MQSKKVIAFVRKYNIDMDGIFIRYVALPKSVRGLVIPNNDMTFNVYINLNLPRSERIKVLLHELQHIVDDHLYKDMIDVETAEAECLMKGIEE